MWGLVPMSVKNVSSLSIFKYKIKGREPDVCPCRLCKDYVQGVGFLT